jgi:hypothetical protein
VTPSGHPGKDGLCGSMGNGWWYSSVWVGGRGRRLGPLTDTLVRGISGWRMTKLGLRSYCRCHRLVENESCLTGSVRLVNCRRTPRLLGYGKITGRTLRMFYSNE